MTNFKPYPDDPRYVVGDDGTIIGVHGNILKGSITRVSEWCSYRYISRVAFVHQMVLRTFVGPCPENMQTRHLNGDGLDNRLENLIWGTSQENNNDKIKHGRVNVSLEKRRIRRLKFAWERAVEQHRTQDIEG